jgi:hypothetical protein
MLEMDKNMKHKVTTHYIHLKLKLIHLNTKNNQNLLLFMKKLLKNNRLMVKVEKEMKNKMKDKKNIEINNL